MSADIEFEIVKQPLEEINKQYEGCDISECFAQLLHINFSCEVQGITYKISNIDNKVVNLE